MVSKIMDHVEKSILEKSKGTNPPSKQGSIVEMDILKNLDESMAK